MRIKQFLIAFVGLTVAFSTHAATHSQDANKKISRFGEYRGYSRSIYPTLKRSSYYVNTRDGTSLAVDVLRPADSSGNPIQKKMPALVTFTPYHRAYFSTGTRVTPQAGGYGLQPILKSGYVMVSVAIRGTGASKGEMHSIFSSQETNDLIDVLHWVEKQPWCDGNIGLFGGSYQGITQLSIIERNVPAVKAIFPLAALFDTYSSMHPGGVLALWWQGWGQLVKRLNTMNPAPPVPGDNSGITMARQLVVHRQGWNINPTLFDQTNRDSTGNHFSYRDNSPSGNLTAYSASRVPMYVSSGWFDIFSEQAAWIYNNYHGPKKMMLGYWDHNNKGLASRLAKARSTLWAMEMWRWFDRWLKHIDNGVDKQAPIEIATMDIPHKKFTWHARQSWTQQPHLRFHLRVHNHANVLVNKNQKPTPAFVKYTVNYQTSTGQADRWSVVTLGGRGMAYPDMSDNDKNALIFTTKPLTTAITFTGYPTATIKMASNVSDFALHVLLEEVTHDGVSHYITEGVLRASHRSLGKAPFDTAGSVYHSGLTSDLQPMPIDQPQTLTVSLMPTSVHIPAGDKLRLVLMGADAYNYGYVTPKKVPVWTIDLMGSSITLPALRH